MPILNRRKLNSNHAATYAAGGGASNNLLTNLVGYWEMGTTSFLDSSANGLTFTGVGSPTVSSASSPIQGNYLSLSGTGQYLEIASENTLTHMTNSVNYAVAFWVRSSDWSSNPGLFIKRAGGNIDCQVSYGNVTANRFQYEIYDGAVINDVLVASSFGAASTNTWYFIVCNFDVTNTQLGISVNNGTYDTMTKTRTIDGLAGNLRLGTIHNGGQLLTGNMDQVGLWIGRTLSAGDRTFLYNGGAGRTFAELA